MTRAERKESAEKFRIALKLKWLDMIRREFESGKSMAESGISVDVAVHEMKQEHPQKAAVIDQAYREFARQLGEELSKDNEHGQKIRKSIS